MRTTILLALIGAISAKTVVAAPTAAQKECDKAGNAKCTWATCNPHGETKLDVKTFLGCADFDKTWTTAPEMCEWGAPADAASCDFATCKGKTWANCKEFTTAQKTAPLKCQYGDVAEAASCTNEICNPVSTDANSKWANCKTCNESPYKKECWDN